MASPTVARMAEEAAKRMAVREHVEAQAHEGLTFGDAMNVVLGGGKVTREAWNAPEEYVFLRADIVHLHKADGSEHKLIVGSGDVAGEDWTEV